MAQIQDLVEAALAASSADGCIVVGEESTRTNLRWAGNSLTTNGQMSSRSVTVIATFDKPGGTSAGVVTRAVTNEEELASLVRDADEAGRAEVPADDAAPIVANYPHHDDWAADPVVTDIAVLADFAAGLRAEFDRWRTSGRQLFGYAEHSSSSYFVGTSTGLRRRFDQPNGTVGVNAKTDDYTRSAYVGQHTRDFTDVDPAAIALELDRRLGWAAKRVDLPAGRYETIMPPSTVADMLLYAYFSASARDADEGRSVYAGRVGDALTTLPLRLYSDPAYPGLECAPFEIVAESSGGLQSVFDNGQPIPSSDLIGNGVLTDLVRTRAWAANTGATPRAFVDNLILDGAGTANLDEMIATTERGLLLTCLWYIREVDPQTLLLTGLTRDGVYLVEHGEVTATVNNFRFNESPVDLLGRISEIGRTERTISREWGEYLSRTAMPPLRIPDFNMSTVSQAM